MTFPRQALIIAAGAAALLTTASTQAGATTAQCGNTPRCFGLLSHQQAPLEIDTAVPAGQVTAGTALVGHAPVFSARGDWHVTRNGPDRKLRWAPNGVSSDLCVTATSDRPRSQPTLQACTSGTAGSSHQLWHPVNVIGGGFRVYQNVANGLVLTIHGTASGSPVQIRSIGAGTGDNKNFVLSKPF